MQTNDISIFGSNGFRSGYNEKDLDIIIFSEGTYPYVKGGVSSWIQQLIKGRPEINFGICFIGALPTNDKGALLTPQYDFPDNLIFLRTYYLFGEDETPEPKKKEGSKEGFEELEKLYNSFKSKNFVLPKMLENLSFYLDTVSYEDFLFSRRAWEFINEKYMKNCDDLPFIDYFWTLRNVHKPIWIIAKMVRDLPKCKLYHTPSTGYAGFAASLASYHNKKPMVLTEHGIYTRERKIDLLSADWIQYKKPTLLQQTEEYNYIKRIWIEFFEKIGLFCYTRSNIILSLFGGARNIQIKYGAKERKCFVIPNGVDIQGLGATMQYRQDPPKKVITLIGRVVPIKDIKTFIRAIKIAHEKDPTVQGWIIGGVSEDIEYANECQDMAIALNLKKKKQYFDKNDKYIGFKELTEDDPEYQQYKKNKEEYLLQCRDQLLADEEEVIKFFGHSNIKDYLPHTAIQTLSSISEGMPLVILEGFAAGVPCVATDVGSCRELIEGGIDDEDRALGRAGSVTAIADPGALAKEYLTLLDFKNGLWKKAQDTALKRVHKYYEQTSFLGEYKSIYDTAFGKSWEEYDQCVYPYLKPYKIPKPKQVQLPFEIETFQITLPKKGAL